jgi:branched-chain amino acid transport system substrate-binding protein
MDADTRKFSKRFFDKIKRMPTMVQAGVYSSTLAYLNAIKAAGTDDADAVMAQLKKPGNKINDFFAKGGYIRGDGRMVHDMYLFQVKKPAESKYAWDYYNVLRTIPAEEAFQPLSKSTCSLIKK